MTHKGEKHSHPPARIKIYSMFVPRLVDGADIGETEEKYSAWLEENLPEEGRTPCNPGNLALWIEALRSGRYELGWGGMKENGEYNPLGVLCQTYLENTGDGQWVEAKGPEPELKGVSFFECSGKRWMFGPPSVVTDWVGLYLDGVKDLINLIIPSFDHIADILERHPEWFLNAPEGGWWKRLEVPHNPASAKLWIQALRDGSMVQSKPRSYDFNPDPIPPGSWPEHNPIHDLRRGHPEATPEDDVPTVAYSPLGALCEVYRQQTGKGDWVNLTYYSGEHHSNKNQFICYGDRKEIRVPEPVLEWAGLREEGAETILNATREGSTFEEVARMLEEQTERFFKTGV